MQEISTEIRLQRWICAHGLLSKVTSTIHPVIHHILRWAVSEASESLVVCTPTDHTQFQPHYPQQLVHGLHCAKAATLLDIQQGFL